MKRYAVAILLACCLGACAQPYAAGRYLDFSIELRRTQNDAYSAVAGFFKTHELVYIGADEMMRQSNGIEEVTARIMVKIVVVQFVVSVL